MAHGEVTPPVEPMLAKAATTLPDGDGWCYEPKWDGFRAIAFRDGGTVYLQSRDLKPLDRYFPEVHDALVRGLPDGAVVDGEVVIATPHGLDFDALQMRLHPAASRVEKLSRETPASFVAFDVLAADHEDLRSHPLSARRARLEALASGFTPSLHLTPLTRDRALAADWLARFEGAGLDGVVAKHADAIYEPGRRTMVKIKHVAHRRLRRRRLPLAQGRPWHARRLPAARPVRRCRRPAARGRDVGVHDGRASATGDRTRAVARRTRCASTRGARGPRSSAAGTRMPGGQSRWSAGKDLSWEPLRIERVCEVTYDHLQGNRFRHATVFRRWRPDKPPEACRYDQLEVTTPYELARVFSATRAGPA